MLFSFLLIFLTSCLQPTTPPFQRDEKGRILLDYIPKTFFDFKGKRYYSDGESSYCLLKSQPSKSFKLHELGSRVANEPPLYGSLPKLMEYTGICKNFP